MQELSVQTRERKLTLHGAINFRDQGGNLAQDGRRIKSNLLFRAGALSHLSEPDCQSLAALPIQHILDYRDVDEVNLHPDIIWPRANYQNIPANPINQNENASLSKLQGYSLRQYYPPDYMIKLYQHLPFANPAYHQLIKLLAQPEESALVQHCAVGKDRTGVGGAIVLWILGASAQTVMEDYLLTEIHLQNFRQQLLANIATKTDESMLRTYQYMLSAREEFLITAIQAIEAKYSSINSWLQLEYGVTPALREQIQQKYLLS